MKMYPLFEDSDYTIDSLLVSVAAGEPVTVGDEIEEIDLNYMLARGNPYAMLIRVNGDSMSSEIRDGDWVIIDRRRQPEANNIVLASIKGGYTIKRFKKDGHRGKNGLYLVPANEVYAPRKLTEDDAFDVIGVVTHVIHSTV